MLTRFISVSFAALLMSSACVPSAAVPEAPATNEQPVVSEPNPVPPTEPASPPPVSQPKGEWLSWPIAQGDWVYRQDDRGSLALFGKPQADAILTLRCDRQRRRIYLARKSKAGSDTITIRTSAQMKQFSAMATGGSPAYLATEIPPTDPILDAMAYSRGRVAIQTAKVTSVAIPVWSEMNRVIEDCRR